MNPTQGNELGIPMEMVIKLPPVIQGPVFLVSLQMEVITRMIHAGFCYPLLASLSWCFPVLIWIAQRHSQMGTWLDPVNDWLQLTVTDQLHYSNRRGTTKHMPSRTTAFTHHHYPGK